MPKNFWGLSGQDVHSPLFIIDGQVINFCQTFYFVNSEILSILIKTIYKGGTTFWTPWAGRFSAKAEALDAMGRAKAPLFIIDIPN